jgi:hypothetical protein
MTLKDKQIKKFQMIYKNLLGKEISKKEARDKGIQLVRLLGLVYKPMTVNEYNQIQKRREKTKNINI